MVTLWSRRGHERPDPSRYEKALLGDWQAADLHEQVPGTTNSITQHGHALCWNPTFNEVGRAPSEAAFDAIEDWSRAGAVTLTARGLNCQRRAKLKFGADRLRCVPCGGSVLSVGKLAPGQGNYYLHSVAQGAEDYYLFSGEAPGRWVGGGCGGLGLQGRVESEQFTSVLDGRDPATGDALGKRWATSKLPGFDLTFSAPKSVSVLWALGDEQLSRQMRDAHDRAVEAAVGYLERTASHARRGHAGCGQIETNGFLAAAFRHRTSRAGDPNLHTHVVVANRVRGSDGRWSALDGRALYRQARTAGTLYQSHLRHELRELGLTWNVAQTGVAEIDGVPRAVRREFSQRRQEIERSMAERGTTSARGAQIATLQTRKAKDYGVQVESLADDWRQRAEALGFDPTYVADLLRQGRQRATSHPNVETEHVYPHLRQSLLSQVGLTERASTFRERDVLRALAIAERDGMPVTSCEQIGRRLLSEPQVVHLGPTAPTDHPTEQRLTESAVGGSEHRMTTADLLATEAGLIDAAVRRVGEGCALAVPAEVDRALADRPHLSDEQVGMIRRLTEAGDGIAVVHALAGSGKTTALGAAVEAWRASGNYVLGACLSARAAAVLRNETGLETSTLAQLLLEVRDSRFRGFAANTVLLVDEAGQVGTRAVAELAQHLDRAGGKLVLVGDTHQLPEIEAGGAFRGLAQRLPVAELTVNYRQADPAEKARVAELRSGDVEAALRMYDEVGRLRRGSTADEVHERLVADWYAAWRRQPSEAGRADVIMLGLTNAEVEQLNQRARTRLAEEGLVGGPGLVAGPRTFQPGDHVVTRQNDRTVGVLNGDRWVVVAADLTRGELELRPDGREGEPVRLPRQYLDREELQHGYALTVNVAQGSTVDAAFILGSDSAYREAGYTAATRARNDTSFYVVEEAETSTGCGERHGPIGGDPADALDEFAASLERSRAQSMAIDIVPD